MRVFSFGGGVQSTAVLVLAAQGQVQYDAFVFANVGDDSENPDTIQYVNEVSRPFAERHGITIEEVKHTRRDGSTPTLLDRIHSDLRSVPIPMRVVDGRPGRRTCTGEFKIKPIARWMKQRGATAENPFIAGLGISLDEFGRMRTSSGFDYQVLEYPLIERRITRADCIRIVTNAGLPIPPKSSCWFCPYHRIAEWSAMRREKPEQFEASVAVEKLLNDRSQALGRKPVFLSRYGRPLDQAVGLQTKMEFDDENCDGGYCGV